MNIELSDVHESKSDAAAEQFQFGDWVQIANGSCSEDGKVGIVLEDKDGKCVVVFKDLSCTRFSRASVVRAEADVRPGGRR